jgi:meromycolic acid enoyl-[acyl-carrier-protein] reductase
VTGAGGEGGGPERSGGEREGGGLLQGKRLLITGVLTKGSIAYSVAERAQQQGAQIVLTGFGRTRRMTERAATRLPDPPDVLELDVNNP